MPQKLLKHSKHPYSMQMDYKIKCKEYEKMCGTQSTTEKNNTERR